MINKDGLIQEMLGKRKARKKQINLTIDEALFEDIKELRKQDNINNISWLFNDFMKSVVLYIKNNPIKMENQKLK